MRGRIRAICRIAVASVGLAVAAPPAATAGQAQPAVEQASLPTDPATLGDAYLSFYSGRYVEAADRALAARAEQPDDLAGYELRTSALLFQLKRAITNPATPDKREALKQCQECPQWLAAFQSDTDLGKVLARKRLAVDPSDEPALFFLAKLDLNYVWMQLEPLGRKKGWNEYWEARRSLDALLERNPQHVRGRVARAWIDYIVDTKLPRGTRWLLGGGNRKGALVAMREAAGTEAEYFSQMEAAFGLWDMEMRERNVPEAVAVARGIIRNFPENRDVTAFLAAHDSAAANVPPGTER